MDPWLALVLGLLAGFSLAGWIAQQNPRFFGGMKDTNAPHKVDWWDRL